MADEHDETSPPPAQLKRLFGERSASEAPPLYQPQALLRLAHARLQEDERAILESVTDRPALKALCEGFTHDEFKLNFFGRKRAELTIVDALVKRARLAAYIQRYPQIAQQPIKRPILIIAPFRTGTTFLHRLLAQDPALRWPRSWEMFQPPPPTPRRRGTPAYFSDDERIAVTTRYLRGITRRYPDLAHLHPANPHQAEECFALVETTLSSPSLLLHGAGSSYLDWLFGRSDEALDAVYALYASQLRLLNWWHGGERWVLKSPFHLFGLRPLLAQLPESTLVRLHRDPVDCLTSFCMLLRETARSVGDHLDPAAMVGPLARTFMREALQRAADVPTTSASAVVDVSYDALRADPMEVVRRIYLAAEQELSPTAAESMADWLAGQSPRRSALRMGQLAEFGISEQEALDLFAPWSALMPAAVQ